MPSVLADPWHETGPDATESDRKSRTESPMAWKKFGSTDFGEISRVAARELDGLGPMVKVAQRSESPAPAALGLVGWMRGLSLTLFELSTESGEPFSGGLDLFVPLRPFKLLVQDELNSDLHHREHLQTRVFGQ